MGFSFKKRIVLMFPTRTYLVCLSLMLLSLSTCAHATPIISQPVDVATALQYLTDLDQLYSAQVRPSKLELHKKSGAAVGTLGLIGDSLAMRVRPRFGKRAPSFHIRPNVVERYGRGWFDQK